MAMVFLARKLLGALTVKAGCSTVHWKAMVWRKMFLKGMERVVPALTGKGPWGLGGRARPMSGML